LADTEIETKLKFGLAAENKGRGALVVLQSFEHKPAGTGQEIE